MGLEQKNLKNNSFEQQLVALAVLFGLARVFLLLVRVHPRAQQTVPQKVRATVIAHVVAMVHVVCESQIDIGIMTEFPYKYHVEKLFLSK